VLPEIPIVMDQPWDLFLQTAILLYQKPIHGTQLLINRLEAWCLFPLCFSTPAYTQHPLAATKTRPLSMQDNRVYSTYIPSVLEPDFDLLWIHIGEKGAFSYQLLATKRWRLWALVIEAFQGFHLLPRISNILVWLWLHSMLTVLLYFKLIGRRNSRAVS